MRRSHIILMSVLVMIFLVSGCSHVSDTELDTTEIVEEPTTAEITIKESETNCLDSTRTIDAGGPGNGPCKQFYDDPESCEKAYALSKQGNIVSCFYDSEINECEGCGPKNMADGSCTNVC